MVSNNLNHKPLLALTLFYQIIIYSSESVIGSYLSFNESQCQNLTAKEIFLFQCRERDNSSILFEMITNNTSEDIIINCHEENPFYIKFLPKSNIRAAKYAFLNACQFPADEQVQRILKTKLGILEISRLKFNNEFIDYFPTRINLKGLDDIDHLTFNFKNLSTIPKDFFEDLKLLKNLQISSITPSQLPAIFDSLDNLKKLFLTGNDFQNIPGNIFKYQRQLKTLFLMENKLTNITKESFEGLVNLSILYLSYNNIETLQPDVFSNLISLEIIYLSDNNFISLPENLLNNLLELRIVTISDCQLESISSKFFDNLKNLYIIDISGNNLDQLPLGLFDDQVELTSLIVSNNKIQSLPNGLFNNTRNLETLDLTKNQLKFLSNELLKPLKHLQNLNLNYNLLGRNLSNNHLQSKSPFDHLTNLKELLLKNNSLKEPYFAAKYLTAELIKIDLSLNNIETIDCDYLQYFKYAIFTGNPIHCDCKIRCLHEKLKNSDYSENYRYKNTFKCHTPKDLNGRALMDLESTELLCYLETNRTSFLKQCSNECQYSILDSILIMNCSNGNLTKMPVLPEFDQSFSNGIKLYMQGNPITELPSNTTQDYQNISVFSISNRLISKLPDRFFSNLLKIETVHIDLPLLNIPSDLFTGSTAIKVIEIKGMNLDSLPEAIFESQTELFKLVLSGNGLKKLKQSGFSSNINLRVLDLSHNSLESLTELMFYQLQNLRWLNLSNNHLHDVSSGAFKYTNSLREIRMENNDLTTIEPFLRLKNLEEVNLSFNKICSIELSDLFFIRSSYFNKEKLFDFRNNNIHTISVNKSNILLKHTLMIRLEDNPLNCDCNIISFLKVIRDSHRESSFSDLQCINPDKLKDRFLTELRFNELLCRSKKCPKGCHCWDQPYDSVLILNCSDANLTEVPQLSGLELTSLNQIELSIEFNKLKRLKLHSESRWQHVTKIYAANNMIDYISTADIPKNLSYLDLAYNKLETLDTEVINALTECQNLNFIRLSHNPWICDCSSEKLRQFIMFNKTRILDLNETLCANGQSFENLTFVDMCSVEMDNTVTVISIALAIVGLSICLLTVLFFNNKERVLIWMYAQGICLWWVTEEDLDKNKTYDAFVSYSTLDTNFVVSELLPKLEGGPTPFKLCLHDRDWIVGVYIPDQIEKSVELSKRTIILMSGNYLRSKWTRLEFRAAHNHSLNEKLPRVIVVIIGDIGEVDDLDSDLRKYIKMYTYLKWDDPWFWKKLRYAMPHPARKTRQNEETEV